MLKAFANFEFGGTQGVLFPKRAPKCLGRRPQDDQSKNQQGTPSVPQETKRMRLFCGVSTTHLRALRSPRDPHPPALLPIVHAITASWILLRAAGSAVAARKSHSRACHFGVVFGFAVRELLAERLAVSKWWPAEAARYGDAIALVQRRARDVRTHALQLELSCWHKDVL